MIAILALVFVFRKYVSIKKKDAGTPKMQEISDAIHEGAMAFLFREYKILAIFVTLVFLLLWFLLPGGKSWITAVSFLIGAIFSVLAGFIGMTVATKANVRTTQAAKKGVAKALEVAFASEAKSPSDLA